MECCLCEKLQYVGKSEYSLNLRIITRRTYGPPCDKQFQIPRHNFNAYGKFNIIEQVNNLFASTLPVVKTKNINWNTTKMRKAMETIYIYLLTDKTNEPRVLQVISSFHLTEQITFVPEIVRPLPEWLVLVELECIIWFLGTSVINFPRKLGACHLRLTMHLNLINLWL